MAKHSLNWNWGFVLKGWLVGWCVIEAWWEAYLQPRSVSLVCASSSCPARNYRELSNPGEAACAIAALCALIHSTWPAPRGLERATAIGGSVAGFKKNGFGGGWGGEGKVRGEVGRGRTAVTDRKSNQWPGPMTREKDRKRRIEGQVCPSSSWQTQSHLLKILIHLQRIIRDENVKRAKGPMSPCG